MKNENQEQPLLLKTELYSCTIERDGISLMGKTFGITIPPGDMLAIAESVLSERARLERQQQELDQRHQDLVQEVNAYCVAQGKAFSILSDWDAMTLMRELAGSDKGYSDEWKPVEQLSPAGRWYRQVCCDEHGGIYTHIWEPFYAALQKWQQREAETEVAQHVS